MVRGGPRIERSALIALMLDCVTGATSGSHTGWACAAALRCTGRKGPRGSVGCLSIGIWMTRSHVVAPTGARDRVGGVPGGPIEVLSALSALSARAIEAVADHHQQLVAAGQNLERLLSRRGWGRRGPAGPPGSSCRPTRRQRQRVADPRRSATPRSSLTSPGSHHLFFNRLNGYRPQLLSASPRPTMVHSPSTRTTPGPVIASRW